MLRTRPRPSLPILVLLAAAAVLPACEDTGVQVTVDPPATELGVVVGSVDLSLTIFPVDTLSVTRVVGLGFDGSPVSVAVRDGLAAVPMGLAPAVAVVDLASATLARTVALPVGSGATGVAFVDDSTAMVANPGLNTVTPVNVRSGAAGAEIAVGVFPQAVVVADGRVFVLNGELENFVPARPGTVTVLSATTFERIGTVQLSGQNPSAAVVGADGRLYVLNSGTFAGDNGSLSVVDPGALDEIEHHEGFGDFPGSLGLAPDGTLAVASFQYGVAVWDPASDGFLRSPDDAVAPDGIPSASGLGFDADGRLYTLDPDCVNRSRAHRLDPAFAVEASVDVGICPLAIAFADVATP